MSANERQTTGERFDPAKINATEHGGDHYKRDAIQVWDFVAANEIPYFEATAIKYLCRWKRKGGIEDLRKAIHFIEKLISLHINRPARLDVKSDDAQ
jgi:hypothetical protein